jgi:hypothetical protein
LTEFGRREPAERPLSIRGLSRSVGGILKTRSMPTCEQWLGHERVRENQTLIALEVDFFDLVRQTPPDH